MTLKFAVSRSRPSVPYGANFSVCANFSVYFQYFFTVYSKMGRCGKSRNSKNLNLPRWATQFGKWRCGIWQNLLRKTVGPTHSQCPVAKRTAFHRLHC